MEEKNNFAVVGLVLGIVCLVLTILPLRIVSWLALPAGIVGIVLSVKGRKIQTKKGMATAGMVLSIIGLALWALVVLCVACAGAAILGTAGTLS